MIIARRLQELRVAGMFLSRLPMGRVEQVVPLARTVWAWPLIGGLIGLIFGGVHNVSMAFGLSHEVSVILAIVATLLASGALHEDGLADLADGIGGGASREKRLEIMRDSRLGSYGAMALIMAFILNFILWRGMAAETILAQAISIGAISRMALPLWLKLFPSARAEGLGVSAAQEIGFVRVIAALAIGCAFALLLPISRGGFAIAACLGVQLAVCLYARSKLGGITGDVMGATQVIGSLAALLVVV